MSRVGNFDHGLLSPLQAFRELQATPSIGSTTNPEDLTSVRLLFSIGRGTLEMQMSDVWGIWDYPHMSLEIPPEGNNVLPARIAMDVVVADELMKRAGWVGAYSAVYLIWPQGLSLGKEQPYYCFMMERDGPETVYVGTNDGSVATRLPVTD